MSRRTIRAGGFSAAPLLAPSRRTSVPAHTGSHIQPHQPHSWKAAGVVSQKIQSGCPPWFNWVRKTRRCFAKWCATTKTSSTRRVRPVQQAGYCSLNSLTTRSHKITRSENGGPDSSQEPQSWRYASDESSHHELFRTVGGSFRSSEGRTEK